MNPGISFLQGGHHVAQKSSKTTLPLNTLSATSLPLMSLTVKLKFETFPVISHTSCAACEFGVCAANMMKASAVPITMPIIVLSILASDPQVTVSPNICSFLYAKNMPQRRISREFFQSGTNFSVTETGANGPIHH